MSLGLMLYLQSSVFLIPFQTFKGQHWLAKDFICILSEGQNGVAEWIDNYINHESKYHICYRHVNAVRAGVIQASISLDLAPVPKYPQVAILPCLPAVIFFPNNRRWNQWATF